MNAVRDNVEMRILLVACAVIIIGTTVTARASAQDASAVFEGKELKLAANISYDASNLRDPFEGYIVRSESLMSADEVSSIEVPFDPPELTIQGITWGGAYPQAIIDNQVYRVGESVKEVKIINISRDGLILSYQNRHYKQSGPGKGLPGTNQKD
jgi:hypothetical protein